MLSSFQQHIGQLVPSHTRLLLAVSGGIDSVVLTDLVAASGYAFEIAHCNFQLRGEESMRDEHFVRSLAERYGKIPLVKRFDTDAYAVAAGVSIQEAARILRYEWFTEIVLEWGTEAPSYILTAHHADDNIETLLMRFFRGTGLQGLTGIPVKDEQRRLLRPLLSFRKSELEVYAREKQLSFVEDSSNASDKYTRNFFRNRLLPQVREVFPQVDDNLLHNLARFREADELYRQMINLHLSKLLEQKQQEWHVPIEKLRKQTPLYTITWEIIKPFGFHAAQTGEAIKLLDAVNGSHISSSTHRIIRNRNWLIIAPLATAEATHVLVEEEDKEVEFAQGKLSFSKTAFVKTDNPAEAFINPSAIRFPLLLRPWKTGDYFYPLGMKKKKKLNRFFIDQKLSATRKEKVWVLESDRKIVWVIGYRIDDRCRINDPSQPALRIVFTPSVPQ